MIRWVRLNVRRPGSCVHQRDDTNSDKGTIHTTMWWCDEWCANIKALHCAAPRCNKETPTTTGNNEQWTSHDDAPSCIVCFRQRRYIQRQQFAVPTKQHSPRGSRSLDASFVCHEKVVNEASTLDCWDSMEAAGRGWKRRVGIRFLCQDQLPHAVTPQRLAMRHAAQAMTSAKRHPFFMVCGWGAREKVGTAKPRDPSCHQSNRMPIYMERYLDIVVAACGMKERNLLVGVVCK